MTLPGDCALVRALLTCAPANCPREEPCFRVASWIRDHGCEAARWLPATPADGEPGEPGEWPAVASNALDGRVGGGEAA
jgi:hypothetical protein